MKTLILIIALTLTGCGITSQAKTETVKQQTVVTQPEKEATSHLCGAKTKDGKTCTRKVSDEHGQDAKCFQHRAK